MIISEEKKYIFIHIPKSAGHSIFNLLTSENNMSKIEKRWNVILNYVSGAHVCASRLKTRFKGYEEYFKFAFIRNPFDRIVSLYWYVKQNDPRDKWIYNFNNFTEFVYGIDEGIKGDLRKLSDYICDDNGNILVDFLGRIENLAEDFKIVANKLNIEGNLSYHNTSKHKNYRDYYTKDTKKIIEQIFKDDLERFGYEF